MWETIERILEGWDEFLPFLAKSPVLLLLLPEWRMVATLPGCSACPSLLLNILYTQPEHGGWGKAKR